MLRHSWPFLADEPPVVVDWLPWSHTFGGNHNLNLVLFNGGTLYIDDGRPVPPLFARTLSALEQVPPTVYFNVPPGTRLLARRAGERPRLRRVASSAGCDSCSTPARRCPNASRFACAKSPSGRRSRSAAHLELGHDGDLARRPPAPTSPTRRSAASACRLPGVNDQARAGGRQARSPGQRSERDPGLFRAPRSDRGRRSTRKASTARVTRSSSSRR